ncbi:hypothetical protein C8A05DRAFT_46669 [Staphylotrichum tortipilum]|uniref:Amidoligase enzyme-domain-containing protein n=1 Tax=Staphylotrichum tortipilum TaxID=2831512 RepID=A0AAN6RQX7_9PEZI|nr:hypothetical protein C8A05DRAFT_46669 [Staphylotrichum longicolle]
MAPFILDDERQSPDTASMDSNHAAGDPTTSPLDDASQTAEADRPEDISIALEWKLLLPLLAPGHEDPRPKDVRPLAEARRPHDQQACLEQGNECVARTIKQAGEQAVTMHGLLKAGVEERDFWSSSWVVKKANSAKPLDEEKAHKGYIWVPVEICSPKMRFQDPKTQVRMQRVLDALNTSHRIAANCTCEVHIHLGRMDGQPWSLSTLQRLGALLWAGEPTLRSIRDPHSPNADNLYTWGFAMHQRSRLATLLETPSACPRGVAAISDSQTMEAVQGYSTAAGPATLIDGIVRICGTTSHLELGQLLSGPEKMYRRLGFNFSAFGEEDERARRNPRTMEFRMMDGSVDTHLIMGWLAICGTIAETAVARSDSRYAAALEVLLQRPDGGRRRRRETLGGQRGREFRELMQALGISTQHYREFESKIRREHY